MLKISSITVKTGLSCIRLYERDWTIVLWVNNSFSTTGNDGFPFFSPYFVYASMIVVLFCLISLTTNNCSIPQCLCSKYPSLPCTCSGFRIWDVSSGRPYRRDLYQIVPMGYSPVEDYVDGLLVACGQGEDPEGVPYHLRPDLHLLQGLREKRQLETFYQEPK